MFASSNSPIKTTSYKVILPFYAYAAVSFFIAALLVFINPSIFQAHHFHPHTLAITHIMALGWGTMMILGASHQLFPVIIEGKLYSNFLAYLSFFSAGIGIPLLIYSFYIFQFGSTAQLGGILINVAVLSYLINFWISIAQVKTPSIHAIFVFSSVLWLLLTTFFGLLLLYNFTMDVFSESSVHYLSLHAHLGVIGWFLLMVMGVGSRLIPMFLISKYENKKMLNWIYLLINAGLIAFIILFIYFPNPSYYLFPIGLIGAAILIFGKFLKRCHKQRIRKKVDGQVRLSLLSVLFNFIPIVIIALAITLFYENTHKELILLYGFMIFFGWITAIIMGMTFKTLPFIVWNKVYSSIAGIAKTPNPKELFSDKIYLINTLIYLMGIAVFIVGILVSNIVLLTIGASLLLIAAFLYNLNLFKVIFHKRRINDRRTR